MNRKARIEEARTRLAEHGRLLTVVALLADWDVPAADWDVPADAMPADAPDHEVALLAIVEMLDSSHLWRSLREWAKRGR